MEIATQRSGDVLELKVRGRLDAYWADHLSTALDEAVREGADRIQVDMAEVSYMSSVGIRVLLRFYKQLQRIKGSFAVCRPSEAVKTVLELSGLQLLLAGAVAATEGARTGLAAARSLETENAAFDVFDLAASPLRCRVVGDPGRFAEAGFGPGDCRLLTFPEATFGLGLGAFGRGFADSQRRFGEFVAAGGGAAYLPTDGTNVPDLVVATGGLVPELNVLYGIACDGVPSCLARFEGKAAPRAGGGLTRAAPVPLSEIVAACLDAAAADAVGVVMVAESAGLMGAALLRSPVNVTAALDYPRIREWLSFTPERAHSRSLALVVGIALRAERSPLMPLLRPLGRGAWPAGHFHAAAFSYRPLQKGRIELAATVSSLFESETLQGVLHLLADDRDSTGRPQSEFLRGACWVGPIAEIGVE